MTETMVSVPLSLLKQMHKAEYAQRIAVMDEDDDLSQLACMAFESAVNDLYWLMEAATPEDDPDKVFM